MHIGDKVKVIRGTEEGVVTRIINSEMIEIEIQDGFVIPIQKKAVVVVSQKEAKAFGVNAGTNATPVSKRIVSERGLYLAFSGKDTELACYLINNTDYEILFAFYEEKDNHSLSIKSAKIDAKEYMLLKNISMQNFETWPTFVFKYLKFMPEAEKQEEWVNHRMKFKIHGFRETLNNAPLLDRKAYLFQLDQVINTQVIKEKIVETKLTNIPVNQKLEKPSSEIDLHIEKIRKDHMLIGNADKLKIQLETFENMLANALATDMDEITFIHGNGNGTLKNAIHKSLSKNKLIKFFKDAQKDKFGYGATLVKLK